MKNRLCTLLVAALAVTITLAGAPVAADHAGTDSDVVIHNSTTATEDLGTIWVDVAGADSIPTATNSTNVSVVIDGYNATAGSSSELYTETLNVSEGAVASAEYQVGANVSDDYSQLNLTVSAATAGNGQYLNASASDWGTTTAAGGGGGGLPGGSVPVVGVAIIALGYFMLKED